MHWKQNATLSSGYATRKRSMTKSFVASNTTSISLKLACSDEDNSLRVSARQTTNIKRPRDGAPSFAVAIVNSDPLRSPDYSFGLTIVFLDETGVEFDTDKID